MSWSDGDRAELGSYKQLELSSYAREPRGRALGRAQRDDVDDDLEQRMRDLAVVMLLHDTGMRVGELARLEIDQVEEDCSATIETEKTVQRRQVFWKRDTDEVLPR